MKLVRDQNTVISAICYSHFLAYLAWFSDFCFIIIINYFAVEFRDYAVEFRNFAVKLETYLPERSSL